MSSAVDILAVDDDKISQKMIRRALESAGYSPRPAFSGEEGIEEALRSTPDIILLDVEMPGLSGYEVCDQLRQQEPTKKTPIVFLSSHSSLRERMQGYEVGADDYLVKPFEPENLTARIGVLLRYREQNKELEAQYALAKETALLAMAGTSEIGMALGFLERSHSLLTREELADALFDLTRRLDLSCCILMETDHEEYWYSSDGSIKPLEKELITMSDRTQRFVDFGARTIVNYQHLSLLVRNMPLDDMQRYGRTKDLLPLLLSAVNTKAGTIRTEQALIDQSKDLLKSFGQIRTSFYYLVKNLLANQQQSNQLLRQMLQDLNYDLLRMGLEDDQEAYVLNRIDTAIEDAIERIDASDALRETFSVLLPNMRDVVRQQRELVDAFSAMHTSEQDELQVDTSSDIELF